MPQLFCYNSRRNVKEYAMQQSDQHNKKYKSMFFDLDGTLLGNSRVLHPDTRRELARAKERGDRIYLCSGRPPVYLRNDICPTMQSSEKT